MKKILLNIALFVASFAMMAQVGIGTSTPEPEGALDVMSTNSGIVLPRVDNTGTAFSTKIKLILSGNRNHNIDLIRELGTSGYYWTSGLTGPLHASYSSIAVNYT